MSALEKLKQLEPIQFRYKKEFDPEQKLRAGFSAQQVQKIIPEAVVEENGTTGVIKGSLERWYSEEFTKDSANSDVINLSKEMITNTSKEGYIGSCEAIKKLDYLKELSTINKEILYISGEIDMGAPAMAMEEMHHLTPNSKYECISGAAHILNIECAEKVNNIILDFLN